MGISTLPRLTLVAVVAALLALAGCSSGGTGGSSPVALQGLWHVTPGGGSTLGVGGPSSLEFGAGPTGLASYLGQSTDNGITDCRQLHYTAVTNDVVLLDGTYYQASSPSADRIVLTDGFDTLTLDRVSGAPPVAPCGQAIATLVTTLSQPMNSRAGLSAVGSKLYYNVDDSQDSIIGFDTSTDTLGTPRVYSQNHRFVLAARSDALFYGQCYCGANTSVDYFDLDANTSTATADTDAEFSLPTSLRYGAYAGSSVIIGGNPSGDFTRTRLLTLDPDTLALVSQREILRNADVTDVTMRGSELLALADNALVVVGSSGMATTTYRINGGPVRPEGVATVGSTVYLIGYTASSATALYRLTLP